MSPSVFVASYYYPDLADRVQEAMPHVKVVKVQPIDKGTIHEDDLSRMRHEAEIVFFDTLLTRHCLHGFKRLKWIQAKGAGVNAITRLVDPKCPPDFMVTRITANSNLVGEYVMMMILAMERNLFQLSHAQKMSQWKQYELACSRSLDELSIGIIGVGAMGKEIARRCKQLGMTVNGIVRTIPNSEARCENIDLYTTTDRMIATLESCDYICCALPSTAETKGLLSRDVLSSCKIKKPVFINVGRGDVIHEETITSALEHKWIRGAILDVFSEEPLPESSPLWNHPDVVITPHIAGYSRSPQVIDSYVKEFSENYQRYISNQTLQNLVDFSKGY